MLLQHTTQRFMVASAPSWKAWDFHANICLKSVYRKEKAFSQAVCERQIDTQLLSHTQLYKILPSPCISRGWCRKQAGKRNRKGKSKSILFQAQKFTKAVYLLQEIDSLASEGGMKTFTERYAVLKDILKFRKWGKNIKVSCSGDNLAEGDSKNLTIERECQKQDNEIKKTGTNQKILEEGTSESNATDQGIQHKQQNLVEEIEPEIKKHEKNITK